MTPARSALPLWATLVCAAVIVYASLQPFSGWALPPLGRAWLFEFDLTRRFTRSDLWLNVAAYVPFGVSLLLLVHGRVERTWSASPVRPGWSLLATLAGGFALSITMELCQVALPPRVASVHDVIFNTLGTLIGGVIGLGVYRSLGRLVRWRRRWIVPGAAGDLQIVLLALWLLAQVNPAIPVFGTAFHPGASAASAAYDPAIILIEAVQTGSALIGIGLFADLMMRRRLSGGVALVLILALALVLKWLAAEALLTPPALDAWLRPGHSLGLGFGAVLLTALFWVPRQWKSVFAGVALMTSVLVLALLPDVLLASAPLSVFALRFGHLLHLNGLTQAVAIGWPLAATLLLFWRFGVEVRSPRGASEDPRLDS
ncbi:MAG: VanZ family protein [Casimicrobiaceae bacterium]